MVVRARTECCRQVPLLIVTSCFFFSPSSDCKMPAVIERAVRKQNVHFLHNRIQYSIEFFQFMRKLVTANAAQENSVSGQYSALSTDLILQLLGTWKWCVTQHLLSDVPDHPVLQKKARLCSREGLLSSDYDYWIWGVNLFHCHFYSLTGWRRAASYD